MRYEFTADDAFEFAHHVGIEAYKHGDQLIFKTCPYCRGGKNRDTETFAISLETGQFNCKRDSCGVHGGFTTLARDFNIDLGFEYQEYTAPVTVYKRLKTPEKPIEPKPPAVQYLEGRGISQRVAEKYQITVRDDNQKILVFPFFDQNGILQFVKYRNTEFVKGKDKAKEWPEKDTKPILFGMMQCGSKERLIITEGQMDALSLAEVGYENAVSVPMGVKNFRWVPYCWDWVNGFKEIIVFGDHENGHITLVDEIAKRFTNAIIKHPKESDYLDCKDANDILLKYGKQQLIKCVNGAEKLDVPGIIRLADVKPIDINSIPKIRTGISKLDDTLHGGLPFGFVHILGGKRGQGKSTLASQIFVEAREQGYRCMAYSGELPNEQFRAWMDYQVAGPEHVEEIPRGQYKSYLVPEWVTGKISRWYGDECYLYDNSNISGGEGNLLKLIELAIQRDGCQFILVDNLMSGIDLMESADDNEYRQQKQFVAGLANLVLKYKTVMVLLVAHKRKASPGMIDENDEISGNSYITNRAGVVINYDRFSKQELDGTVTENDRKITITKNRLFGTVDFKGFPVHFDQKSKRIYGDADSYTDEIGPFEEEDGGTPFD